MKRIVLAACLLVTLPVQAQAGFLDTILGSDPDLFGVDVTHARYRYDLRSGERVVSGKSSFSFTCNLSLASECISDDTHTEYVVRIKRAEKDGENVYELAFRNRKVKGRKGDPFTTVGLFTWDKATKGIPLAMTGLDIPEGHIAFSE